jgi:hypothetical protein
MITVPFLVIDFLSCARHRRCVEDGIVIGSLNSMGKLPVVWSMVASFTIACSGIAARGADRLRRELAADRTALKSTLRPPIGCALYSTAFAAKAVGVKP